MKSIVAALLLVAAVTTGPSADVLFPAALTLQPGYASGPPAGFPWLTHPDYGDPLTVVARVAEVSAPFADLLPPTPCEITCVFEGSTCSGYGNWDYLPCAGGIFGMFENGTVAFYLDTTPDADFANPATFRDGDLVLLAGIQIVSVLDDDPGTCLQRPDEPDMTALFVFTGGSWFPHVSDNGDGLSGMSGGQLDDNVPAELQSLGYIFRVDGTFDVYGPVATEATTWGHLKALYR